jgi:hypothetical protein
MHGVRASAKKKILIVKKTRIQENEMLKDHTQKKYMLKINKNSPIVWCKVFCGGIFAYKTSMGIWIFLLSAGMLLAIAFLKVGYQSVKAALANPANSIRYE